MITEQIESTDLDDLSRGAVFLATGGGGDPYIYLLLARQALTEHGPVALLDPATLDDDAFVVTLGIVGAPTASLELLPSASDALRTLRAFESHVGRRADAVISFEIGGGNSLIPLIAGAEASLPVVDGDGMGRALPEAQMMTYPISGVAATPALAMDYAGNFEIFETDSIFEYERQIRQFALSHGGMITAAEHPMTGRQVKDSAIAGTMSFSVRLGRLLRENRGEASGLHGLLAELFADSIYGGFRHLYTGKLIDRKNRIEGGFDVGEVTLESFDGSLPHLVVTIKNEYLLARMGDRVLASVPDLITIVDFETGEPINAERLRYGQRLTVFGIGCPAFYRSPVALEFVKPRCFGLDLDYVPIEDLETAELPPAPSSKRAGP